MDGACGISDVKKKTHFLVLYLCAFVCIPFVDVFLSFFNGMLLEVFFDLFVLSHLVIQIILSILFLRYICSQLVKKKLANYIR